MLMQNYWQIFMQLQNGKQNNILHVDGYNLMYHKLILLSKKPCKNAKLRLKEINFLNFKGVFINDKLAIPL